MRVRGCVSRGLRWKDWHCALWLLGMRHRLLGARCSAHMWKHMCSGTHELERA